MNDPYIDKKSDESSDFLTTFAKETLNYVDEDEIAYEGEHGELRLKWKE